MIPIEKFKKTLPIDHNLTEEEILKLRDQLNYLAEILVDIYFDEKVAKNPDFKDPRINKPIYDLVSESKKREKKRKILF